MATKGVKTFKFTDKEGNSYRIKLYSTGIYTLTDKNGEHECGTWEKKPLLVGRYLKPSKDPNSVIYIAKSFTLPKSGKPRTFTDYNMRDLAFMIIGWETLVRS